MTGRKMRRRRRWAAAILATFLLWGSTLGAAADYGTAVRLTEVLEQAQACGPAFEALARAYEQQRLTERRTRYDRLPAGRVTLAARLNPELSRGGRATLDWQVTDDLTIDLNVPVGTPPVTGTPGPLRASVTATWSKRLWPDGGSSLRDQLRSVEEQVTALELREQEAAAFVDVIGAFYALRAAQAQFELDTRQQELAQGRVDHALRRFEQGMIGLRELQTEQSSLHQATAAVERSWRDVRIARERLLDLAGMLESGSDCADAQATDLELVDDIDWEAVIGDIAELLALPMMPELSGMDTSPVEPTDAWEERFLEFSLTYQRARMTLLNAQISVAAAEATLRPAVSAEATVQTDLEAFEPTWAVGLSVAWDLAPRTRLDVESARLNLEGAESQLAQTRRAAIDTGRAAWRRVVEATRALARAEEALEEALWTQELAHRRIEAGLAPEIEREEALLQVDRRRSELDVARAERNLAWLALAQRLGIDVRLK